MRILDRAGRCRFSPWRAWWGLAAECFLLSEVAAGVHRAPAPRAGAGAFQEHDLACWVGAVADPGDGTGHDEVQRVPRYQRHYGGRPPHSSPATAARPR